VFGNDDKIDDFLQSKNDFECANIDVDSDNDTVNKLDSEEINENEENSVFFAIKR
jgi:hypothetical protein